MDNRMRTAIKKFIRLHDKPMTNPIFKTITIGGKLPNLDKDIYVSDWAKDLVSKIRPSKKKEDVSLVICTPKDLGFTSMPTTAELFDEDNLAQYGVELCPPEVGIYLRNKYLEQPQGEWLYIAHTPITDSSDGVPFVFNVECDSDGSRWLDGFWAYADNRWDLGDRIVFRLRKISQTSDALNLGSHSDPLSLSLSAETSVEDAITVCKKAGYAVYKIM